MKKEDIGILVAGTGSIMMLGGVVILASPQIENKTFSVLLPVGLALTFIGVLIQ